MTDKDILHPDHLARMEMLDHQNIAGIHYIDPEGITFEDEDNDLHNLIDKVVKWHYDRNLIEGSTDKDQVLKLAQELGELSDSVCKGKDVKDDIGDMLVVMLNIAERNGVVLSECLKKAWDDIKHRKGRMIDGIFVKETDL